MDQGRRTLRHYVGGACAVVLIAAGTATAAVSGGSSTTDYSGTIPAGTTLSGVLEVPTATGGVRQGMLNFGIWRGKPTQVVTAYTGTSSWSSITGITAQGQTQYWANTGVHVAWSIPLIPSNGSDTLANAATGADDANYKSIAQQLVAGGESTATLRLGWETGGNWFAWSGYQDPASYVGAWQHAVTAMRSVPGQHFTFDWDYALHSTDPNAMYPGDSYVDYVSADVYDMSWASSYPASDHAAVWNSTLTETDGLNWLAGFASTHGKRLAIPEWGENYRCDGHGGGDDPYFVQQMRAWISSHDVAYESYANGDNSSCEKYELEDAVAATATFPSGATAYLAAFGSGAPNSAVVTASAAPTTAAPSTAAPTTAVPTVAPTTAAPSSAAATSQPVTSTSTSAAASSAPVTSTSTSAAPVVVPSAPVPATGPNSHHVDFGAQTSTPAAGYTLDYGLPYDDTRGYGWEDNSSGAPLSLVGNGRERDSAASIDQRYDTLLQMQQTSASTAGVMTPGRWEMAVANGTYSVTVGVGDPIALNSTDVITAESGTPNQTPIISSFVPSAATPFQTVTKTVTVSDGRLTLDPTGGVNTKLDFVDAVPVADTTAPTSTITLSGQQDVTATVASTDNAGGSGVATVSTSLDGGPSTPYTAPIVVTTDGPHTLTVTTTDLAGNTSTASQSWTELHDTVAPTAQISLAGQQDITATVTASDNPGGSGLATTTYTLDGGPSIPYTAPIVVTTDGPHTLAVTVTDNYGNSSSTTKSWTELHDSTPPTSVVVLAGNQDVHGTYTTDVNATVIAADDIGGSGLATTMVSLDGATALPYTAPISVTTDGNHTLTVTATDNDGNTSTTTTTWTELHPTPDTVAPVASVTLTGSQAAGTAYSSDVAVSIAATDNVGVTGLTYSLDGATARPYTAPISVTTDGNHSIVVTATDAAGNAGTATASWTEQHPAPAPPPTGQLEVSANSDRSQPVLLNGATLRGAVYIFADVPTSDLLVAFSLDGKAFHNEYGAPFDFAGTSATGAFPFLVSSLASGTHTITTLAMSSTGAYSQTAATFTVVNPPTSPLQVSYNANRSSSFNVNGARLTGTVYVFDVPASPALVVNFFIDGKLIRMEVGAPYDLGGSGPVNALPYNISGLAKGTHTIKTVTTLMSGATTTVTGTFTVV